MNILNIIDMMMQDTETYKNVPISLCDDQKLDMKIYIDSVAGLHMNTHTRTMYRYNHVLTLEWYYVTKFVYMLT